MKPLENLIPDLKKSLEETEQQRLDSIRSRNEGWLYAAITFVGSAALAVGGLALTGSPIVPIVLGVIGLIACGIILHYKVSVPYQAYRTQFKYKFIEPMIRTVAQDVQYFPFGDAKMISEYKASELYPQRIDRSKIEDTIYGRIEKTDIRISELHTEYKTTTTDSKGRKQTKWHTIFKGLFISADFHKDFHGCTFVRSDVAEKTFGLLGRMFQKPIFSSNQLVILEDPDFEKEFVVNSSDQVEARYILSPSMMQKMLELKHRFSANIEFSFLHSRMFIAISTSKDYFEPTQSQSLMDDAYLHSYLDQIYLCLGVVEDLGLNVRIWSKQ